MIYTYLRPLLRIALLGALGASLAGCGNLKVTMGVLKPEVVRQHMDKELVSKLLPVALAATPATIGADVGNLRDSHRAAYASLQKRYELEAAKLPQPAQGQLLSIARDLTGDFSANTAPLYADLQSDLVKYQADLKRTMAGRYSLAQNDADQATVVEMLRVWQQRVQQTSAAITRDIRKSVANAAESIKSKSGSLAVPDTRGWVREELAGVTNQLAQISVQNSPAAYAVANASDANWAESYNHVLARSAGGASDVAIKLDPFTGNYLLKGLSFDPSDVAAVAAKVTTQALLVAAQVAGVPVKLASAPDDGSAGKALAQSSGALADAQAAVETRRVRDDARKAALMAIANVIVNEEIDFKSADADTRKAAIAAIRTALDKRLTLIRPANP